MILAQDPLKNSSPVKLHSFSINGGSWFFTPNELLNVNDYEKLGSENSLIKNTDKSFYKEVFYGTSSTTAQGGGSASAGFLFYNKNKKYYSYRHQLNLGFIFVMDEQSLYLEKEERVRFDTLKGHVSSEMFLIDTLKRSRYEYSYQKDQYFFSIGYTTHTLQNRILSLYMGLNLVYGLNYSQLKVRNSYYESFTDQNSKSYDYAPGPNSSITKEESTKLKQGQAFLAYMPIGGVLRFSRTKKGLVKRLALNAEVRIGGKYEQYSHKVITNAFFNINFGVKFFLNREKILTSYRPPQPFY